MPPVAVAETGGGGWTSGARARHHYRERLRNLGFFAHSRTAAYGVASSCRVSRRRQRQQLARHSSGNRRREGGHEGQVPVIASPLPPLQPSAQGSRAA